MNGKHYNSHKHPEEGKKMYSSSRYTHDPFYNPSNLEKESKSKVKKESSVNFLKLYQSQDVLKQLISTSLSLKNKDKNLTYEFNFSIKYDTNFGERIVITGEPSFLGNWDPLKGLELEWSIGNFWRVNILIGEGVLQDFEFKYVCIKNNNFEWENGKNRTLKIEEGIRSASNVVFLNENIWQV